MRARSALYVAIAVVVLLTFYPSLANAPVWDDVDLTTRNPFIASLKGLGRLFTADMWTTSAKEEPSSFYRPVAMASYALNRALLGNGAWAYRLGNLALHAANAMMLTALVEKLGRTRFLPALIAGLAFALAPLNVETVDWLAGRFDLLGLALLLAALWLNTVPGRARYLSVPLVLAALLSKEAFVTGAVLLVVTDLALLGRPWRREVGKWALLAATIGLVFALRRMVGVMSVAAFAATPVPALLASLSFLLTSFGKQLLWPAHLDPFRHYLRPELPYVVLVLSLAALVLLASVLFARRAPDDARRRSLTFGLVWALFTLGPVAVTGPNLEMVGDRYAYLPLAGLFLALAAGLDVLLDRLPRRGSPALAAVATMVLAAWGARDRGRIAEWKDERTLFAASVRDDPGNFYALYSLGALDAVEGKLTGAEPLLLRARALRPSYWRTENALCFVWLNQNRLAEAERACLSSLDQQPENPRVWLNLTSVYVRAKLWPRCLEVVDQAVVRKPRSAEPRYLRAVCRANLHDYGGAGDDVDTALGLDPDHRGALDLQKQLEPFRGR